MAIANTSPDSITFKQSVTLSTLDLNNSSAPIAEGYIVNGPTTPGVTPLIIAGGTKVMIPLTTATGNGSPFLKIHYPSNPSGNTVYLTYCVANSSMVDGYYDYKTGVPTTYYNSLRNWINTNPATGIAYSNPQPTVRTRSLKFTAYGNITNVPGNSITFYINLQGTFVNGGTSGPAVVVGGTTVIR